MYKINVLTENDSPLQSFHSHKSDDEKVVFKRKRVNGTHELPPGFVKNILNNFQSLCYKFQTNNYGKFAGSMTPRSTTRVKMNSLYVLKSVGCYKFVNL